MNDEALEEETKILGKNRVKKKMIALFFRQFAGRISLLIRL